MCTLILVCVAIGFAIYKKEEIKDFINSIRKSAPRKKGGKVMIPGDPEREKRKQSLTNGIELREEIINQLKTISEKLKLTIPKF